MAPAAMLVRDFGSELAGTMSRSRTGTPALARWAAMREPMAPAPRTAARRRSGMASCGWVFAATAVLMSFDSPDSKDARRFCAGGTVDESGGRILSGVVEGQAKADGRRRIDRDPLPPLFW